MEVGAGIGAITLPLARRGVEVWAVEVDPVLARRLRERLRGAAFERVRVIEGDVSRVELPARPSRVIGRYARFVEASWPFAR